MHALRQLHIFTRRAPVLFTSQLGARVRCRAPLAFNMSSSSGSHSTSYSTTPSEKIPSSSSTTSTTSPKPKPKPLALPEAPHSPSPSTTTQLDISSGSTSVKLDHLGPMVVNVDGTLSRISNWDAMADVERENTLRVIGRRNKARLEVLRGAEKKGE